MVLFVDLDEGVPDLHADPNDFAEFTSLRQRLECQRENTVTTKVSDSHQDDRVQERPNLNLSNLSAAVACYPYVSPPPAALPQFRSRPDFPPSIITTITLSIDLNTLHALARTCRQIRANLLQYRNGLVQQTLRCSNEQLPPPKGEQEWTISGEEPTQRRLTSGKVGLCARDLVCECRRCGRVVCRNCTLKPPPPAHLPSRHRRLCPTCLSAPLSSLIQPSSSWGSNTCICPTSVHLCAPCGISLDTADTTYRRIWTWRTRYSTYLGGLGTGIGEGNEGVKCARGKECLGAKDVEVEFDCNAPSSSSGESNSGASEVGEGEGVGTPLQEKEEAGYWRQEVEGLGGIVKKKYRKRERVGGTVKEWEDEREGGEVLGREKRGEERSWCGWCGRVVKGLDEE